MAHVFSINVSDGGVPKLPRHQARIGPSGVEDDRQRNLKVHGGPLRALCLYPLENILQLQREGHPVFPGSIGENITTSGIDWNQLEIGAQLRLGEVHIELTSWTVPCRAIGTSFSDGKFARVSPKRNQSLSRMYARVLNEGILKIGDPILLL